MITSFLRECLKNQLSEHLGGLAQIPVGSDFVRIDAMLAKQSPCLLFILTLLLFRRESQSAVCTVQAKEAIIWNQPAVQLFAPDAPIGLAR